MKIIKKNMIGFIIGGMIFVSVGIIVASQILATQISYSNTKSKEGVTNVDGALTELYGLAEECKSSSSGSAVTYYGTEALAIYLDPTNLSTTCTSADSSDTETKDGCMRFYVYAEDSEYKYAILDHNTTATVAGFYVAQTQVKQDTSGWDPNLQARNISAMEVYKITESTNTISKDIGWIINNGSEFYFTKKVSASKSNGEGYGWLFDRTRNCTSSGCETSGGNNIYGYWTSDAQNSSDAWTVFNTGRLNHYAFDYSNLGVRPVIQITKS